MNRFDWDKGFLIDFNLQSGRSESAVTTKRYLADMGNFFQNKDAVQEILKRENPLIYEYYELGCPEREGDLAFGTTIVYPGKIGDEYYMTKGHFHKRLNTGEVYYVLSGQGYMVMEDIQGHTIDRPLEGGKALYVPRGYAHRSVNTGSVPLVMFFAFEADAGHDYGTIELRGYHHMVCESDGQPEIRTNQKWVVFPEKEGTYAAV